MAEPFAKDEEWLRQGVEDVERSLRACRSGLDDGDLEQAIGRAEDAAERSTYLKVLIEDFQNPTCPPHEIRDVSNGTTAVNVGQCLACGAIFKINPKDPAKWAEEDPDRG